MSSDTALFQLGRGGMPVGVASESAEEVDLRPELRRHHGRDTAAAGGTRERIAPERDLPAGGQRVEHHELDPLDVPDNADPGHGAKATRGQDARVSCARSWT